MNDAASDSFLYSRRVGSLYMPLCEGPRALFSNMKMM